MAYVLYTIEYSRYTNRAACVTFSGSSAVGGFLSLVDKSGVFFSPEGMGQDREHVYNIALVDIQQQCLSMATHSGPVL